MISTLCLGLFWVVWKQATGSFPITNYLTDTYISIIAALVITVVGSLVIGFLRKKHNSKTEGIS